tara:strand:+ start:357 stop:569 length:213 start_codon:yes stop_codon:yes gene_type:complete
MKIQFIFFITIILSTILFLAFSSSNTNEVKIGSDAPNFNLYNQNSEIVSLNDYNGKNLVIYFFPKAFTPG